jgi:gamma-glutamylaminecyclotransferase
MPKIALFVYGTLKRGGRSNHLLDGQEFLGDAQTMPFYCLYDHGDHPCLVEDRQRGMAVRGEVWLVDEATLACLDQYEEVPTYFTRRELRVREFEPPVFAYFYQGDVSGLKPWGSAWSKN